MSEFRNAAREAVKKKGAEWQDEWDDPLAAIESDVNRWWEDRPHQDLTNYTKEVRAE